MRASSLFGPAAAGWSAIALLTPSVQALSFNTVQQPQLDLSSLGRVVLTGDFDAVSLYSYEQQSETPALTNGSQSLLTQLPNGALATLSTADADILAVCPLSSDANSKVVVGGNFTSLGDVESQGIALFDPTSSKVTPLPGLNGSVSALLCDQSSGTVYVGGDFDGHNSSNAIAWSAKSGWKSLSFGGFNGPVRSILKADNGHILFGGSFEGLGNDTSTKKNKKGDQIVNLQDARITSDAQSPLQGFVDPQNVICKTNDQDGAGNTWLLDDYSPGFWRADMNFTFHPTKLRLYNTHQDGRGTKAFRLTALPDNGIMNLTYTDDSGKDAFCDASCPLSDNKTEKYRDFRLVNPVGMKGVMLQILDWYGQGAGLDGIELFQEEIYAYAINDFNEPQCANVKFGSTAVTSGAWTRSPAGDTAADYLSAQVSAADAGSTSVTFKPDIKQSGNYSVRLYTPGCIQDNTCNSRGGVNITGTFATGTDAPAPIQTVLFQTNDYEKYDTIYTGYVDASSSDFRTSVTLTPASGQGNLDVVASRVQYLLISANGTTNGDSDDGSGGDFNGLYDYDPAETSKTTSNINEAGSNLNKDALITSMATHDGILYAAGNFSTSTFKNIMSVSDGNGTSLPDGGLNAEVNDVLSLDDVLYVGGSFTGTATGGNGDLKGIAAYSYSSKAWSPLGAGVNGRVTSVVALSLNVSTDTSETTVAVSGDFDQILGFGDNSSLPASGFAVWVPSKKNWLQNLDVYQMSFDGQLSASARVSNSSILAGNLASGGMSASGAVALTSSNDNALEPLPIKIEKQTPSGSSLTKRDVGGQNFSGVVTGVFDKNNGRNLTLLGGRFTARAADGSTIQNVLILDGGHDDRVTGLPSGIDSNSTVLTMDIESDTLYAGGTITGNVGSTSLNGFVVYGLANGSFAQPHPAPLDGNNVSVNSIAPRPSSSEVYVGGEFDSAGELPCPSVCFYDTSANSWSRPGFGIGGVVSTLKWVNNDKLLVAGNLTVSNNRSMVATYNTKDQSWTSMNGTSADDIPGPVTVLSPASDDVSQIWLAGKSSTNGSSFLIYYDGNNFHTVGNVFGQQTTIRDVQVLEIGKNHDDTPFLDNDQILLITGQLVLPDFGNASAALFNGTSVTPFILSTTGNDEPGSISQLISENKNTFSKNSGHYSNGIIVLVSFCCALGCVFLIVLIGIILNKIQRHRQGYVRAPTTGTDRPTSMRRVPPEYLFDSLKARTAGVPAV
ncbi:cellular morphogenesis protein (Rax2), putative [Paecilomyces variotii No. 5]|uniref:Cellular morphogenesis protein (Rax2), putative n=1 Tax=Byssochlamys spectabilis (strain No. 5 / NBRC 109023) TaxID=1356009 RepID=V5FYT6_BYSSN|nr:cellular morphogenesis protein (Rax2), putative [Paecilomyces variotii No. 5]